MRAEDSRTGIWPWRRRTDTRATVAVRRHRVDVGGASVSYGVAGTGEPLVLIHGHGGSGSWWRRNVPELSRHFRVYVIDLIGFGDSAGQPFVLGKAARQLLAWMDIVGIEQATIVGHSMGGYVAADVAALCPHRVKRLVLVNAAALAFEWGYSKHLVNSIRGLRYFSPEFFPIAVRDSFRAGPLTLIAGLRQILAADLGEKLRRISAPTLVIWGADDPLIPREIGERLTHVLPNATFALVEGAAHNPMWEQPEALNRLLIDFVAGNTGPPAPPPATPSRGTPAPAG